ncbi:MAG: hypothetical protein HY796_07470 [Elusimicrobia bacterium]|nr:hypothetical protein [Elusimicrobiota bacterium]
MHILNYYFTPFAVILIIFAIYFSEPEKSVTWASFAILAASFAVNYWFSKNAYRFMRWSRKIRSIIVWLYLITSVALFYLLGSYWAPMWLLFLIAPASSAMFMKKLQVFIVAFVSAASMLGVYYVKSLILEESLGTQLWAMASVQAMFVIFFSMFVAAMSEMILKVRDSLR